MPTPRATAEYHDFLVYVYIHAPNEFPEEDYLQPHEQMNLDKAFSKLIKDFVPTSDGVVEQRCRGSAGLLF